MIIMWFLLLQKNLPETFETNLDHLRHNQIQSWKCTWNEKLRIVSLNY